MRTARVTAVGGTRLVGRRYHLGRRPVEILVGWGPGARVRNVRVRFLDDGSETVRPFRGLTLSPRPSRAAQSSDRDDAAAGVPLR